jgi:FemAB-related protein (PEP-CTERM system-associated)
MTGQALPPLRDPSLMRFPRPSSNNEVLRIRLFEDGDRNAWDQYVHAHPSGSLFHLCSWKRTVERAFGYPSVYMLAEKAGKICGILPLFMAPTFPVGRCLISTPLAACGGICADDQITRSRLLEEARGMAHREGVQYLELRERELCSESDFQVKELYVNFDAELPANADKLLTGFPRDTRYMIRKGQKSGLQSVLDNGELNTFYEIYAHSFHQLGTPVFSKNLFRIVLDEFEGQSEITTVWQGKKALAAVLSLRFRDWVLPYFGGSLTEGRKVAVNNFMYFEVMRRAIEAGVKHFDFGRSKLGTGAYAFKTQWNMRERALPYRYLLVRRREMPNFSPSNPKFRLATQVWKSLPFAATKILGPPLVRWFP